MDTIVGDPVRLPAGTPMLIVGFTGTAPFDPVAFCRTMPEVVLVGKLVEPYYPGMSLLLAPGLMSGSIAARGVRQFAVEGPMGAFIAMRHRHIDERGVYLYLAMQDVFDTAGLLENAQLQGVLQWPDPLRFAKAIVTRVAMGYRSLEAIDRAIIRA